MTEKRRIRSGVVSLTQSSNQSQSPKASQIQLSEDESNRLTDACLRYMLNASYNWSTIRRQDIIKNVFGGQYRLYNIIFEKVKINMLKIYGYKIVEVDESKPTAQQQYFLVQDGDEPYYNGLELKNEQQPNVILRYIILSHIYMSGGTCTSESLSQFLKIVDVELDDANNEHFGDIKKRLAEYTKQNYIVMENTIGDCIRYSLGNRARQEYMEEDFQNFVKNRQGSSTSFELDKEDDEMEVE